MPFPRSLYKARAPCRSPIPGSLQTAAFRREDCGQLGSAGRGWGRAGRKGHCAPRGPGGGSRTFPNSRGPVRLQRTSLSPPGVEPEAVPWQRPSRKCEEALFIPGLRRGGGAAGPGPAQTGGQRRAEEAAGRARSLAAARAPLGSGGRPRGPVRSRLQNKPGNPTLQQHPPVNLNHYATKKSVAESMLDAALFLSNATRLKALLEQGPTAPYYTALIVLLSVSLLLQVAIGVLLVVIARLNLNEVEKQWRLNRLNNAATALVFITVIVNVFITAFGAHKTGLPVARTSRNPL